MTNYMRIINDQGGSIEDNQIRTLPKCAVKNCNNNGIVLFGGKFVCGHHISELNKKFIRTSEQIIQSSLEELENDTHTMS